MANRKMALIIDKLDAHNGRKCPSCGAREGIESNGARYPHVAYGCHGGNGCGEPWDAIDYAVTDDERALLHG